MIRIRSALCAAPASRLMALMLATLMLTTGPAAAQQAADPADASGQTPAEIAATDLLNRGQTELGRQSVAGRAETLRQAQEQYDAWAREAANNERLQAEYRETLRLREEAESRAAADHARILAACRARDRVVCDAGWAARGLTPPER